VLAFISATRGGVDSIQGGRVHVFQGGLDKIDNINLILEWEVQWNHSTDTIPDSESMHLNLANVLVKHTCFQPYDGWVRSRC
jgi:hypothetical protein